MTQVITFFVVGLGIPVVAFIFAHWSSKRIDFSYFTDREDEPELDGTVYNEAYNRYEQQKY